MDVLFQTKRNVLMKFRQVFVTDNYTFFNYRAQILVEIRCAILVN